MRPVMKHFTIHLSGVLLSFVACLAACSAGTPSVDQAQSAFVHELQPLVDHGFIKLDNATKVDGASRNFMGQEAYELDWSVDVSVLKDLTPEGCGAPLRLPSNMCGRLHSNKPGGAVMRVWIRTHFMKTESGWRFQDDNIRCSFDSRTPPPPELCSWH